MPLGTRTRLSIVAIYKPIIPLWTHQRKHNYWYRLLALSRLIWSFISCIKEHLRLSHVEQSTTSVGQSSLLYFTLLPCTHLSIHQGHHSEPALHTLFYPHICFRLIYIFHSNSMQKCPVIWWLLYLSYCATGSSLILLLDSILTPQVGPCPSQWSTVMIQAGTRVWLVMGVKQRWRGPISRCCVGQVR